MFKRRLILMCAWLAWAGCMQAEEPETLAIGEQAPGFRLEGVDGKIYTLESFSGARVLTVVFTANHCPTAQAYEERIKKLSADYAPDQMQLVAISSNHPGALCLEEMGYSDLGDSFGEMKIRAAEKNYPFPYLYDGETQEVARAFGAKATPHVFVFDGDRKLRYRGRIDDREDPYREPEHRDARDAIDALLAGKEVPVETTKAFGCSMKWLSKMAWREKLDGDWAAREVDLEPIDADGVKQLVANAGDRLRLINFWATWCGPCIIEFPEFVDMQRMYGNRGFEVVSVSMDLPGKEDKVMEFLKGHQAAFGNYLYSSEDRDALVNAVDPQWQGNLPYTVLLAPGGEVVYAGDGIMDPLELRRAIVGKLGRYYADD
jgi:thiol-disulfide isomerase/thioredoxin